MKDAIEYSPDVRQNVSERRADFYRALPGRIDAGYIPCSEARKNMDRSASLLLVTTCFMAGTAVVLFGLAAIAVW